MIMEESWQSLMGIDNDSEDGPSSPVFYKNKWIILPKSGKDLSAEIDSGNNKSAKRLMKFPVIPENISTITVTKDNKVEDGLIIYNTTPTKKSKNKRKQIDLLSCSFKSEESSTKKSKLNDDSKCKVTSDSKSINKLEHILNESISKTKLSEKKQKSSSSYKNFNLSHQIKNSSTKPQRKLLYSSNKTSDYNAQKLTVNDVFKSIMKIDEADRQSSKERKIAFDGKYNKFQTVTSLNKTESTDIVGYLAAPNSAVTDLGSSDDSFRNCMFSQIERECLTKTSDPLKSNNFLEPVPDQTSSTAGGFLMNDSFSNCRFTEIEEGFNFINQDNSKVNSNGDLKFPKSSSPYLINSGRKSHLFPNEAKLDNKQENGRFTLECKSICQSETFQYNEKKKTSESKNDYRRKPIKNSTVTSLLLDNPISLVDNERLSFIRSESNITSDLETNKLEGSQINTNHLYSNNHVNGSSLRISVENEGQNDEFSKKLVTSTVLLPDINRQDSAGNSVNKFFDSVVQLPQESASEIKVFNNEEHYFSSSKECVDPDSIITKEFKYMPENSDNSLPDTKQDMLNKTVKDEVIDDDILNKSSVTNTTLNTTLTDIMKQLVNRNGSRPLKQILKNQEMRKSNDRNSSNDTNKLNETSSEILEKINKNPGPDCNHPHDLFTENSTDSTTLKVIPCKDSSEEYLRKIESKYDNNKSISSYYEQHFDDIISAEVNSRLSSYNCSTSAKQDSSQQFLQNNINATLSSESLINIRFNFSDSEQNYVDLNNHVNEIENLTGKCSPVFSEDLEKSCKTSEKDNKNKLGDCIKNEFVKPTDGRKPVEEYINTSKILISESNSRECGSIVTAKVTSHKKFYDSSFVPRDVLSQNWLEPFDSSYKNTQRFSCDNQNKAGSFRIPIPSIDSAVQQKHLNFEEKTDKHKFFTAGGKNIYVSEDCLKKVKFKFKDLLEDPIKETDNNLHNNYHQSESEINLFGNDTLQDINTQDLKFSLSQEKVDTSENTLEKVNDVYEANICVLKKKEIMVNNQLNTPKKQTRELSGTVSNSIDSHKIVKSALKQPSKDLNNKLLTTDNKNVYEKHKVDTNIGFKKPMNPMIHLNTSNNFMFSTALGKNIKITTQSLNKIKSIFNDDLESNDSDANSIWKSFPGYHAMNEGTVMSSSGINLDSPIKEYSIENQNLSQIPKLIEVNSIDECFRTVKSKSIPNSVSRPSSDHTSKEIINLNNNGQGIAFSTAAGRNIIVSDDILAKVKSRFSDVLDSTDLDLVEPEIGKFSNSKPTTCDTEAPSLITTDAHLSELFEKAKSKLNNRLEKCSSPSVTSGNQLPKIPLDLKKITSTVENSTFSPTNGKNINLDIKSVEVKSKLSQIEFCFDSQEGKMTSNYQLPGNISNFKQGFTFSTALGKDIGVSENALAKVKQKINNLMEYSHPCIELKDLETKDEQIPEKHTHSGVGKFMFSTAGGKNVNVSEKALSNVRSKLNEVLEDTLPYMEMKDTKIYKDKISPKPSNNIGISGDFAFSTAGGKNVNVSEKALSNVRSKFNEVLEDTLPYMEMKDTKIYEDKIPPKPSNNIGISGDFVFSTAGGKNVNVSDKALSNVRSKFNEVLEDTLPYIEMKDAKIYKDKIPPTPSNNIGISGDFVFSTAGGKNVNVSEDALSKVRSKFRELLEDPNMETYERDGALKQSHYDNKNEHCLFPGNSQKNIEVSKDALTNSKINRKLEQFSPCSDLQILERSINNKIPRSSAVKQVSTISQKDISTLDYVKSNPHILEKPLFPIEPNIPCEIISNSIHGSNRIGGITHSSNIDKNDRVLEDFSKSKFGDDCLCLENKQQKMTCEGSPAESYLLLKQNDNKQGTIMFSTAAHKDVHVSEEAFKKVQSIFNDKFETVESKEGIMQHNATSEQNTSNKKENTHFTGGFTFSNALGKSINVSEDALAKVKERFSDLFENPVSYMDPSDPSLKNNSSFENSKNLETNNKTVKGLPSTDMINLQLKNDISNDFFFETDNKNVQEVLNSQKSTILFNKNVEEINKKSKSRTERSDLHQPPKKKRCFYPEFPKKLGVNVDEAKGITFNEGQFAFSQSISQSVLDDEINDIEKDPNCINTLLTTENNYIKGTGENNSFITNKDETRQDTQESDLSMICEVSDSTAAFLADCTPDRTILSSPSSFFNRRKMKPINLLGIEFDDVDDEIIAAAESKIISNAPENKNSDTKDLIQLENMKTCPPEILLIRCNQRLQVDKIIKDKETNPPIASPGIYLSLRNEGRLIALKDYPLTLPQSNLTKNQLLQNGLMEDVINISPANATDFKFCAEMFFRYNECFSKMGTVDIGNGFSIILSDENKIGLDELVRTFLAHPNIDPSLIPSGWIKNHFKWIVWKLACYEKAFPKLFAKRYLTPENVLHQLKYRYDREIDLAQRSALKRILECDEPSSKRLIICVADIRKVDLDEGDCRFEIELTDGWYSVWTCVDPAMINLINQKKVKIGTKLLTQSAELLNCTDGCDPLELLESIRLKIHTNSTRRVKWNAKMGFTRCPGPIHVSLNSIIHNGGLVGITSAIITRIYPMLFMSKDADGKTVIRNAQAENHVTNLKQNDLTLKSEELYEKLLPQVESKYKTGVKVKFDRNNIKQIKNPQILWNIISNESDPSEIQALLTTDQLLEVRKYHETILSKIREEVQTLVKEKLQDYTPSQKVKRLLKLRLVDPLANYSAILTVWNPSEDLSQLLAEKRCFDLYCLNSSGLRDKVLQLSNTKLTIFKESNVFKPSHKYERKITAISDILSNSMSSHFGELDIVGVVIFVKEPEKSWGVTNVYLSDIEENFIIITFWTSLKTFGCEDVLKPGSTVAATNLQWRQGSGSYVIPSTYANELTCFSSNPNQEYLSKEVQTVKTSIGLEGLDNFMAQRKKRLFIILKEREYIKTPLVNSLDTPKVLKRLENLKKYGEASPLPRTSLLSSPDIYRKFKSPKCHSS